MSNLQKMTVEELKSLCKERKITGYSTHLRDGGKAGLIKFIDQALDAMVHEDLMLMADDVGGPDEDEDEDEDEVPVSSNEQPLEKHFHSLCDEAEKFAEEFLARESEAGEVEVEVEPVDTTTVTCLSLEPAMAYAVIFLGKNIENRSWRTDYTGWVYIHASKTKTHHAQYKRFIESLGHKCPDWEDLPKGCLIGRVWLEKASDSLVPASAGYSPWGINGQYWWYLRDAEPLQSIPTKGRLGLFEIEIPIVSEAGDVEVEEEPVSSGAVEIGNEVQVSLDGFSLDGEQGVIVSIEKEGALVRFPIGDCLLPTCILNPVGKAPKTLKIGDNVEISGFLLDGERGVVIGCDGERITVALPQQIVTLTAWALKKVGPPVPPPPTQQEQYAIYYILGDPIVRAWMTHCGAEIEDELPVFSFEKHHNLQLVLDAAKENPFLYMGLFWDGDKSGWVGLWLSEEKSLYFSGDFEKAQYIFNHIKAIFWDFNTLQDISTETLRKYQEVQWKTTSFRDEDGDGMIIFEFEDDRMSHKDGFRRNQIIDIDLFEDNHDDEAFLPVTINEERAVLATGTKSEMRDLYKSLFNLLTIGGTP